MKTEPNWKDVDAIINLRSTSGSTVSLTELETALASEDESKTKLILAALRGPTDDYEADLYPFGGVRLTLDIQKRRIKKWYKDGQLVNILYTQALAKAKEKKTAEEAAEAAEEVTEEKEEEAKPSKKRGRGRPRKKAPEADPEVEVEEVDAKGSSSKPRKKKEAPVMKIREQIKFEKLQENDALLPYVPTVDDNYVFPAWTLEFVTMMDNGMNVWLYGGTGAGKSSLVEQVCATGKLPLMYQSFHEDIKPCELLGGKELVDGNTVWVDGPVTKAYRDGFVLLLDEIDAFPPEVQFCLYGILDGKPLVLAENGNEVIKPHPNFRVVATGNTQGRGDDTGMYAGTNILNRALLNRFRPWYHVEYPSEKTYREIIVREGVRDAVAAVIARLAKEINTAFLSGTLSETFSLRDARQIAKVAELAEGDVGRALQLCLLNRLSSIEKGAVTEMFRRIVPEDL
jgi:cobaltochelatase CobS